MPFVLNPYKSLSRWRHGRGFGIHSPFAFRFITEVLRQEYGYYAYLRLPSDSNCRTLFRTIVALRPKSVAVLAGDFHLLAVAEAVPNANITAPEHADMIIIDGAMHPGFDLSLYPAAHAVVFNYKQLDSWDNYKKTLPAGMTFANSGSMAVVAALAYLPRQDFDVKF